jgi:hypothetical protein
VNCRYVNATVAISTAQALFAVVPALLFGGYLLFGAVYCWRKGEVGGFRSPGIAKREESPVRFLLGVIWLAVGGFAFVALGVYWFVAGVR